MLGSLALKRDTVMFLFLVITFSKTFILLLQLSLASTRALTPFIWTYFSILAFKGTSQLISNKINSYLSDKLTKYCSYLLKQISERYKQNLQYMRIITVKGFILTCGGNYRKFQVQTLNEKTRQIYSTANLIFSVSFCRILYWV